jgi:7-cyano-7-deazaguanine synthase
MNPSSALVLFSGGQDSATCLAWALDRFDTVETIGFRYGQRHLIELQVREGIRSAFANLNSEWKKRLGRDHLLELDVLGQVSKSALTADIELGTRDDGLPATFMPGRNLIFLTFAAATAFQRGIKRIVTGVCETDYSGYPDCRDDTIKALQAAINLGMNSRLVIDTPLMWINKADTWRLANQLGGDALVQEIREHSHSCYMGDRNHRHSWGYGCGDCDACRLRKAGWENFTATSH